MQKIFKDIHENLIVWVIFTSIISYLFPSIFTSYRDYIGYLFGITMLCIGMLLNQEHVSLLWKKPQRIFAGTLMQYTIMPLSAFFISLLFKNKDLKTGIIITGCVPGAMASNLMSALANADVALSVSVTTLSTLISPVVTPFLLYLFAGSFVKIKFIKMFINIFLMVVLPVCIGYLLQIRWKEEIESKKNYLAGVAGLAIILIVALVIGENRNRFTALHFILLFALLVINISGYIGGYIIPKLLNWPLYQRKTLSLEVGMQNAGLGTVLALKYFGTDSAIPPAIYTILCLITASFLVKLWRFMEK